MKLIKKDSLPLGLILGIIAPILGLILFKVYKFRVFSFKEVFLYVTNEPGFRTLTVALSLALVLNAILFTIFVNTGKDRTATGVFFTTALYAIIIIIMKFMY